MELFTRLPKQVRCCRWPAHGLLGYEGKIKEFIRRLRRQRARARNNYFLIFPHKAGAGCQPIKGNKKKLRSPRETVCFYFLWPPAMRKIN